MLRLARVAMGARFELVMHGGDEVRLRAAGEEALEEIARLDEALSIYRPESVFSRINRTAAREPVPVSATVFRLLLAARKAWQDSGGAFDLTMGGLMRAWNFVDGSGSVPDPNVLEEARFRSGMHLVELDERRRTVRFLREGVLLDAGAIGKGFALDEAVLVLREAGVENALLHGGTSAVYALGTQEDGRPWTIAIEGLEGGDDRVSAVELRDESLSVSAGSGKQFTRDGVAYGHVLDPRRGEPAQGALLAAVVHPSATQADAWSTALLVLGDASDEILRSGVGPRRALVVHSAGEDGLRVTGLGMIIAGESGSDAV